MMTIALFLFVFCFLVGVMLTIDWIAVKNPQWAEVVHPWRPFKPLAGLLSAGAALASLVSLLFVAAVAFRAGGFSGFVWVLSLLETLMLGLLSGLLVITSAPLNVGSQGGQPGVAALPQNQLAALQPVLGPALAGLSFVVLLLNLILLVA